ncbi:5277_t:CDS:2 [Ambispora gerdemannii]|uniref:5277_t:CDS:1 n=1 Tax=Ambispora gerdemannii TaxID=144530 RepID=A0A9N9DGK6_9GLOM|nr:5277_t:CDS:2 [Ambispora gerdemannii]
MVIITRNTLFYRSLIQNRRISNIIQHGIPNNQDTSGKSNHNNNKNNLRPPEKNEETFSGTTDEVAHKGASYDPKTIEPRQEIEKIKHENDENEDRNPLEWSAANKSISKNTGKRGNQPV